MIKEITRKINFHPYTVSKGKKIDTNPAPTVSLNTKYGKLVFSSTLIREIGMAGKFIRLYYEPHRKIVGWQMRDKVELHDMKVWKLCKPAPSTKMWSMTITKMLSEMRGLKENHSYLNLPVQKYREMSLTDENKYNLFYFVEIKDTKEEVELLLNGEKVKV